jgi:alkylhydroperoxidase/carboxymuconolactone decarboxylase family protein YurZ
MRLGVDEIGVTELMAVTEHARAMSTTAAALLLERLDDEDGLIAPVARAGEPMERSGDGDSGEVSALLSEIRAAVVPAMGRGTVPALWRILARNVHYLRSTWRKEQVVMRDGALGARDKRRTALGVAMSVRGRYMIEYHAAILRQAGDDDTDLLEILAVVDHYTTLNTLSEGMQIDSDITPPR